jgi:hypothetical protein
MSRQAAVQQLLQRLRSLDDDPNDKPTKDQTESIMRRAGQTFLQKPRRGEPEHSIQSALPLLKQQQQ